MGGTGCSYIGSFVDGAIKEDSHSFPDGLCAIECSHICLLVSVPKSESMLVEDAGWSSGCLLVVVTIGISNGDLCGELPFMEGIGAVPPQGSSL